MANTAQPGRTESRDATGTCLLCGAADGPVLMAEADFVGRSCECGIIYIDPVPSEGVVDPTVDLHLESYYALPARKRLRWVQRFVPRGRFLDIGCGNGALVGRALASGYDVTAVEPNPACAAVVRERYGIEVEESLIEETQLPRGSFDASFHVDLLSHFPDPVRALRVMADLTAPGGVVCFEVGVFAGLSPRWYPWVGRPRFPAHRAFFSERAVGALLDRAGLDLVAVRRFAVGPSTVVSASLRRALPDEVEAVPVDAGRPPARGSTVQRGYARLHHGLRYHVGGVVPLPGPQTAFVAARPRSRR
jgi:SAM-dependent methyltransferase